MTYSYNSFRYHRLFKKNRLHYTSDWCGLARNEFLPDKNSILLNSVSVSLFFDGHIKVVNQNGKTYAINLKHGGIYHLSATNITKIGQIVLNDFLAKISGKHLFIQDLDREKLIFFTPVKFFGRSSTLPSYQTILSKEELKTFFHHHNIY